MPALLQIVQGPGEGTRVSLDRDCLLIGRGSYCDVRLPFKTVYREHARIVRIKGRHYISTWHPARVPWHAHAWVNDTPIPDEPSLLVHRDCIRIRDVFEAVYLGDSDLA